MLVIPGESLSLNRCNSYLTQHQTLNPIRMLYYSDACSKTPIVGTRFHATKVPDFDLCDACYKSYQGEDLGFVPELLGKDINTLYKYTCIFLMDVLLLFLST
jgi:hypothetical protein